MSTSLKEKWETLKTEEPNLRIRNAADKLGVSEAELLATNVESGVIVLNPDFAAILQEIESLGKVMALTRNDEVVHERKGVYLNPDFSSPFAQLFVGEDIDLRIFLNHWKFAFAVEETTARGESRSIQFFGKDGQAIHKIYLTPNSNVEAFHALVEKYKAENQTTSLEIEEIAAAAPEKADSEIDVEGFQESWRTLEDTHNFFMMMRKYGVSRLQALRLAPDETYAKQIDNQSIVKLIEAASEENLPIMVFVGNKGMIQIHTGNVKKTLWHNQWFNIMDPDFNLHLNLDGVAQTWIVRKPTTDGVVTAIEVYNEAGEIIVQFFGKRKPGIPELEEWRNLVKELDVPVV